MSDDRVPDPVSPRPQRASEPSGPPPDGTCDPTLVRLRGPGDLVVAAPYLVGFRPAASVVAIATAGPGQRIRLTARLDLPPEPTDRVAMRACAEVLVQGLLQAEPHKVSVLLYPPDDEHPERRGGRLPRRGLVVTLGRELARHGVDLVEAVCVVPADAGQDRYWSYLCGDPRCCPPEGTVTDDTTATAVRFAFVTAGRQVRGRREDLVAALAAVPEDDPAACELQAAVLGELARCADAVGPAGRDPQRWRRDTARAVTAMLSADESLDVAASPRLSVDQQAMLVVAMVERQVRDVLIAEAIRNDRLQELVGVLSAVLPLLGRSLVGPVAGALASVAYYAGEGALAWIAVDRALDADPGQSLALLIATAIENVMPPERAVELVTSEVPPVGEWDGEPLTAPAATAPRRRGAAARRDRGPQARRRAG